MVDDLLLEIKLERENQRQKSSEDFDSCTVRGIRKRGK